MDRVVAIVAKSLAQPFESLILTAYWDPVGFPTQGWGRLLSRYSLGQHLREGKSREEANHWLRKRYPKITHEMADEWLEKDLGKANAAVRRLIYVPMTVQQEAALTDFTFNLGAGNLQASTLRRMMNRKDYVGAAGQFVRWNKAGGRVLRGLTRRRLAERDMFLT